ncbi:MAG: class I SAM-dependent methyltransferase [Gaiellaceae bacterium]
MKDDSLRLDNPLVVQWEYASEERLATRNDVYRRLLEGANAEDVAFEAVREIAPSRVLEVGCGTGEFAQRVRDELGAEIVANDISARMVELTAARGNDVQVGDVHRLPYGDAEFDCVVANWVLYHTPDLDRAVGEIFRVLRPGGRLVAATMGEGHMAEMWELVGSESTSALTFWGPNGAEILARTFVNVERRDAEATVVFPDSRTMREFIAATITRAHLAERVPDFEPPFRTRSSHLVFVAEKPAA